MTEAENTNITSPSRRRALTLMASSVPTIAAATAIAAGGQACSSDFLEILAARRATQPYFDLWVAQIPLSREERAASESLRAADDRYYDLIRAYFARSMASPSWQAFAELTALWRLEWWDDDGVSIGTPTDPWLEQSVFALLEKVSGLSDERLRAAVA